PAGPAMVQGLRLDVLSYGVRAEAAVRARDPRSTIDGIRMTVATPRGPLDVVSPLVGGHNVENLLAAVACGVGLELSLETIARAPSAVGVVPGRFEQVKTGQPFLVVVD